jgi:type II secretory pathway component GspD/PulD (secretin)/beta-lactamase regulating signal transducer with metallopeptidase domain
MNALVEALNLWADRAFGFAWPMLWQSSVLIALLFALDFLLKRKARPAVRYALWLVVLVKLLLPPSLALPTSIGWWLRPVKVAPSMSRPVEVVVTYSADEQPTMPVSPTPLHVTAPPPRPSALGWTFVGTVTVSLGLLLWMLVSWHKVSRDLSRAAAAPSWLTELLPERQQPFRVRLTDASQCPAVCGLFRPVILLPRALVERLPRAQLRAVLLHELLHLRRGDVWVNCLQALLQIVYWWHPLLWLANARIRRVREEAVDDAVMLALDKDAEAYPPTLLEVAKLTLQRPLATIGLVGILESRSALRQRIERLMDFRPPRRTGLGLMSALGVLAFAALAVPMGEAPGPSSGFGSAPPQILTNDPAPETSSNASFAVDKEAGVKKQVQDGKLLYEMGKLDEAEAKLKLALKEDPQNQAAFYYLRLVSEARAAGEHVRSRERSPTNAYARSNLVTTSQGRRAIIAKLNSIHFDNISFDGQPLSEVVHRLAEESQKRDPDKVGVNFVVAHGSTTNAPAEGDLGPQPELTRPAKSSTAVPLPTLAITLQPPLLNVRLADVLDAIVKVAERPIKYAIVDYGVVFSEKTGPDLYVRAYKVDPNALAESLGVAIGPAGTNASEAVVLALRDHLARAGVDLDPVRCPAKAMFYNDRQGMLIVRATLQELDTIEQIIPTLNTVPAQVHIKARFVEVPLNDAKASGFEWYLGNVVIGSGPTNGQSGTVAPANGAPTTVNPSGAFPGTPHVGTNSQPSASGPPVGVLGPAGVTGILTESQYRMVVHALDQRNGAEAVDQSVVTVSGRRAQCKMVDVQNVITGVNRLALKNPGLTGTNNADNALYSTEHMEFGPVLDVKPTVLPDGHTINLPVVASSLQFLGYEDSRTNRVTVYVNGKRKQVNVPQPIVRSAQITSEVNVWDGQTLVLGGLMSERVVVMKDAVPVLGDLPLVGSLFRSESKTAQKRQLLVFITPTIIDPAGNRVHDAEDMPAERVPPQPTR